MALRRYDWKCENAHYFEALSEWDAVDAGLACPTCEAPARVVIRRAPQTVFDHTDQVDFSISAGVPRFSNKQEYNEYLRQTNQRVMDSGDWDRLVEQRNEQIELRREVEAKGMDWDEYQKDKAMQRVRDAEEECRKHGVKVKPMEDLTGEGALPQELQQPKTREQWEERIEYKKAREKELFAGAVDTVPETEEYLKDTSCELPDFSDLDLSEVGT